MKFKNWLAEEEQRVPNADQNLVDCKRVHCPQIKNYHAMVDDLAKNGIFIYAQSCNPAEYSPSQNEFDWTKVAKMTQQVRDGKDMYPIVVSRDNVVIDGHHRWLAIYNAKVNTTKYKTTRVNLSYDQFRKFVQDKPYVKYEGI